MKFCKICEETKPLDLFHRHPQTKDGVNTYCMDCAKEYYKDYYRRTREHQLRRRSEYYSENKEVIAQKDIKTKYGLEPEDHNRMIENQDGACAICRKQTKLFVDHCHKNGHVRGLLCNKCNMGIGLFDDNPDVLRAAADYVGRLFNEVGQ